MTSRAQHSRPRPASRPTTPGTAARTTARVLLAAFLASAGVAHLVTPEAFLAQVPSWLPARDAVVLASGALELALALALLVVRRRRRELGWLVAGFLAVITVGNLHQAIAGVDAFGLTTDAARWIRVAFQPLLVAWALWCTGALRPRREVPHGSQGS